MHSMKKLALFAIGFAALGLAGCGGGVEGTYKLDKGEMKKQMEAEIAKMPADQQSFGKLAIAMIDGMDMTVDLQSGGKLKAKSTVAMDPSKPAKTEEKDGTWKAEGDNLTLDTGDGKPLKCSKAGNKLTCDTAAAGEKKGGPVLVLVKS